MNKTAKVDLKPVHASEPLKKEVKKSEKAGNQTAHESAAIMLPQISSTTFNASKENKSKASNKTVAPHDESEDDGDNATFKNMAKLNKARPTDKHLT